MEAGEILVPQNFREKVPGMETCDILAPQNFWEKVPGMETCEIFPTKKLGRRFLEWKLVRFFSHKKN